MPRWNYDSFWLSVHPSRAFEDDHLLSENPCEGVFDCDDSPRIVDGREFALNARRDQCAARVFAQFCVRDVRREVLPQLR